MFYNSDGHGPGNTPSKRLEGLLEQIRVMLGGRAAEELSFGDVTTNLLMPKHPSWSQLSDSNRRPTVYKTGKSFASVRLGAAL